jgi:7-cyano-7-deazaguanine synthase
MDVPAADLSRKGAPATYVPFRNTHLLAAGISWGEVIGAQAVYIGAVEEDSSGYPDCTRAYYEAFNRLVAVGTRVASRLRVETPLIAMTKAQIVRRGLELAAPLHLTWSCYVASDLACGRCDSCALRLRGFRQAGVTDPVPYAAEDGLET